jgi:hypothetical protein
MIWLGFGMVNFPASRLYIIAFLEGYVVLAAELIAIRQLIGYVGNNSDVIAVVIAAVLLPLALGYYVGSFGYKNLIPILKGPRAPLRRRLQNNFLLASLFLTFGLSLPSIDILFYFLTSLQPGQYLLQTLAYALIAVIIPIFLLGQTIPLLSHFFRHQSPARVSGRMLFWSTLGSLFGSIFSTIVIMAHFGVHVAVITVIFLLMAGIILLMRSQAIGRPLMALGLFLICLLINSGFVRDRMGIVYANNYNTVGVMTMNGTKTLMVNNTLASMYTPATGEPAPYIKLAEDVFLKPIRNLPPKRDILVLGAGGFTFGRTDTMHNYTYVDIDPDLKKIAEENFLGEPLTANKHFIPQSARTFLIDAIKQGKKYDLVYLDAYTNIFLTESLITRDFFQQIRGVMKDQGYVGVNFIMTPLGRDAQSRNLMATFKSVFPETQQIPVLNFNPWESVSDRTLMNVMLVAGLAYQHLTPTIYTDDRNSAFLDRP